MNEEQPRPRLTVEDIQPESGAGTSPDEATKREQADLESQRKRAELKGLEQDIQQRRDYAGKIFWLIVWWLLAILGLLVAQGGGWIALSDSVLITAITGTTLNVIGIFLVVANYLFPKR